MAPPYAMRQGPHVLWPPELHCNWRFSSSSSVSWAFGAGDGATRPPPPSPGCPPGKNREGPEETGHGERDEQEEISGQGRPRSLQTVQSAEGGEGKGKRERIIVVVRSPCQGNDPADAHPSAHKSVLESAKPCMDSECVSGCTGATDRLRDSRPPE